jgi:Tfp pilus assembly protein FimT
MTLTELLVAIGISSIITISGTALILHPRKVRMEGAAMELYGMMNRSRSTAMTTDRYAGVFMEQDTDTGETAFWRVVDGNSNGLRKQDIMAGIDMKIGKEFILEKDYPGVSIRRSGLTSGIISFSPSFKSSTGSVFFYTEDPSEGEIRVKLYGLSTLTRPVRVFPDGSEKAL